MKLQKHTLATQVKDVLLDRIIKGKYKPGDPLIELTIAKELGVSQAPVREALQALESMRFVETGPNRRTRVREISSAETSDGTRVRGLLEEAAALQAAQYLQEHSGELREEFEAMQRAYDARDVDDFISHVVSFHRLIVTYGGNSVLTEVWESLQYEAKSRIYARRVAHNMLAKGIDLHKEILDAFAAGNGPLAAKLLRSLAEQAADFQLQTPANVPLEQ